MSSDLWSGFLSTEEKSETESIQVNDKIWDFLGNPKKRVQVCYGGAGSGKSYAIVQHLCLREWQQVTGLRYMILRKSSPLVRSSCYAMIKGMLDTHSIKYTENKTNLTMYVNGNEILFKGVDDPEKIKSIDVNVVWMEEASGFHIADYEQLQFRTRLPNPYEKEFPNRILLSLNPISKGNWVYKHFFSEDAVYDNFEANISTFHDNFFCTDDFIGEMNDLKLYNYSKYRIYGEAQWGGTGELVFENVERANFNETDDDIAAFPILGGIDWGGSAPCTMLKVRIDVKGKVIYICDEIYAVYKNTTHFLKDIVKKDWNKMSIKADSANPDKIHRAQSEFKFTRTKGVIKSKGSNGVNFIADGVDFLADYTIVCHEKKAKNSYREISAYARQKDRYDQIVDDKFVDEDNHTVDALRYAVDDYRVKRTAKPMMAFGEKFFDGGKKGLSVVDVEDAEYEPVDPRNRLDVDEDDLIKEKNMYERNIFSGFQKNF